MGKVVELDNHRPGWLSGYAVCLDCAKHWVSVLRKEAYDGFIQCPRCELMRGIMIGGELEDAQD